MPDRHFGFVAATPDVPLPELPTGAPAALARHLVALADVQEQQLADLQLPHDVVDISPGALRTAAEVITHVYWIADD